MEKLPHHKACLCVAPPKKTEEGKVKLKTQAMVVKFCDISVVVVAGDDATLQRANVVGSRRQGRR
jgi:hypothetical protein